MNHWLNSLPPADKLLATILPYVLHLIAALVIFIVGRWVLKGIIALIRRVMLHHEVDRTLISFVAKLTFIVGMTLIVIAALSRLGVNTTSAVAVLGGAAIAIGLSLQGQLSSFAAGVLLVTFRPIRVGEWVEVGGKSGTVAEVHMFSTTLTSGDNQMVVVPNSQVWSGAIVNYSRNPWRRIDLTIGIAYDADLKRAKAVLDELITGDSRILAEPAASVAVKALSANSVDFAVRLFANNDDFWGLQCDTLERIKLRFDQEGIERPAPQMDVHVNDLPQFDGLTSKVAA